MAIGRGQRAEPLPGPARSYGYCATAGPPSARRRQMRQLMSEVGPRLLAGGG